MNQHRNRRKPIPPPRVLPDPPADYEPTEAELEQEFDMPGLTLDQVRERLFRPFRFVRKES